MDPRLRKAADKAEVRHEEKEKEYGMIGRD